MSEIKVEHAGDGWFVVGPGRMTLREIRTLADETGWPIRWPDEIQALVDAAAAAEDARQAANRAAIRARVELAQHFEDRGQSFDEIGAVLGVSRQRAFALLNAGLTDRK